MKQDTAKKPLSRSELEGMLPDYTFGRLNDEEQRLFEISVEHFPDLVEEVQTVREAFDRFEQTDFRAAQERRARNLSVFVQRAYQKDAEGRMRRQQLMRRIAPLVALSVLILFVFSPISPVRQWFQGTPSELPSLESAAAPMNDDDLISMEDLTALLPTESPESEAFAELADAVRSADLFELHDNVFLEDEDNAYEWMSDAMYIELQENVAASYFGAELDENLLQGMTEDDLQLLLRDLATHDFL